MIDYLSRIRKIADELGVEIRFIEKFDLATHTSTMEIDMGRFGNFQSEKTNCFSNKDIEKNRNYLIDNFLKELLTNFIK